MDGNERVPRKPVNLLLSQEAVRDARRYTTNLSDTVDRLLRAFVAERRAEDAAKQVRIEAAIDMFNEHYERHGLVGEEFIPV